MADLTYAQLKGLWLSAAKGTRYDTNNWATLMAAIAEAESGGNPGALNPNDNNGRQSSFGLWQISNGTHTPPASNWADPAENAKLALGKLQSQGVTAWGTYDSGAYKAYMNGGTTPDTNIPGNPDALTSQQAAAASKDCAISLPSYHVGVFFGHGPSVGGACLLSKSEARALLAVASLAAGFLIMGVGFGFVAAFSRPGQMVLNAVTSITPVGRVAKGAGAAASRPGQALTSGEVKQARANRATLERQERQRAKAAPAQGKHSKPKERNPGGGGGKHANSEGEAA